MRKHSFDAEIRQAGWPKQPMGQYKVPQNVEAEDKILGPLTFKEFIYALIGFGWAAITFALFFRKLILVFIVIGLPPAFFMFLLAFYKRDGQSFEQLLVAMVEFFAASRRRPWIKDAVIETFHVEPTKHAAEISQRNPTEVRSELEKLANLIDSRGWNSPADALSSTQVMPAIPHTDRIVPTVPPPHAPDEHPDDMLDLQKSPLAQNLAELLRTAADDVRAEAMQQMSDGTARPAAATAAPAPISTSGVTAAPTSDILQLATESDDLTVSQLAAQATRRVQLPSGQVVEVPVSASK